MALVTVREVSTLDLALVAAGAVLCLASYCLRLAFHVVRFRRERDLLGFAPFVTVITLGYVGWGYWAAADPVKMTIPAPVALATGISLTAGGIGLFLLSEMKHRGAEPEALVTTGIYRRMRHPMYVGLALLHLGYPLIYRSLVTLSSTVLWVGFMVAWSRFEGKYLARRFGAAYQSYRESTWF